VRDLGIILALVVCLFLQAGCATPLKEKGMDDTLVVVIYFAG